MRAMIYASVAEFSTSSIILHSLALMGMFSMLFFEQTVVFTSRYTLTPCFEMKVMSYLS